MYVEPNTDFGYHRSHRHFSHFNRHTVCINLFLCLSTKIYSNSDKDLVLRVTECGTTQVWLYSCCHRSNSIVESQVNHTQIYLTEKRMCWHWNRYQEHFLSCPMLTAETLYWQYPKEYGTSMKKQECYDSSAYLVHTGDLHLDQVCSDPHSHIHIHKACQGHTYKQLQWYPYMDHNQSKA